MFAWNKLRLARTKISEFIYTTNKRITHANTHTHHTIYFLLVRLFFLFLDLLSAKISSSEEEGGVVGISSAKFNLSLLYFLWAGLINLKNKASNSGTLCKGFMILSRSMLSTRQAPSFRESLIPTLSGCHSPPAKVRAEDKVHKMLFKLIEISGIPEHKKTTGDFTRLKRLHNLY